VRDNDVRKKLAAGEVALGIWIGIADPLVSEVLAVQGWDWLLIDMEHAPIPLGDAANIVTAIRAGGATPFVRPAWNESSQIQRVLDLGAYGIVVPVINSAEDARTVVQDARFPPLGERSRGGVRANLAFRTDPNTYSERANDTVVVLVQTETREAVDNAESILAVDGIDGLFVGPNDLAAAYGKRYPDAWGTDQEYMTAVRRIPEVCKKAGKFAGILARDAAQANEMIALGYRFVGVISDMSCLTNGASAALRQVRDALREVPAGAR
jgi:4-hydroxy-2-oxoheptanedioate aldolase